MIELKLAADDSPEISVTGEKVTDMPRALSRRWRCHTADPDEADRRYCEADCKDLSTHSTDLKGKRR